MAEGFLPDAWEEEVDGVPRAFLRLEEQDVFVCALTQVKLYRSDIKVGTYWLGNSNAM